jgi:hypothetical protein
MSSFGKRALCGMAVATLAATVGAHQGRAAEAGNFLQTLGGGTIDQPFAAPIPPGVYGIWTNFYSPNANGAGQVGGNKVSTYLTAPEIAWATGYTILGGKLIMAVVQPFTDVNAPGPPVGQTQWNWAMANTEISPALISWNLGKGFFAGAGITLIVPDGSQYNGTTNPDYFTWEPRAQLAWFSKEWHLSANLKYDINNASSGHTGAYQVLAGGAGALGAPSALTSAIASIGNGYQTGQIAYVDLAATYHTGKWELGPVATLEIQTTNDSPGGGFTCAQLAAQPFAPLHGPAVPVCGKAENIAAGALVGYDFGPANLQVWAVDSVFTQDTFGGWGLYSRVAFKLPGL